MHARYLTALVLFTALVLAVSMQLHSLRFKDYPLLAKLFFGNNHLVLFGNSVNNHVSKCDLDRRVLASMYSAELSGEDVIDISRGGMKLGEMLYLAEIAANFGRTKNILVIPISPEAGFFKSASEVSGTRAYWRTNFGSITNIMGITEKANFTTEPIVYLGKRYGAYNEFSKTHFAKEKLAMRCPEIIGEDREFLEFMYWRNFLQPGSPLEGFDSFTERISLLKSKGVSFVVWLPPVNFEDISYLHGNSAVNSLKVRIKTVRHSLESMGVPVVDLSETVKAKGFADRWCACGHLNEIGRQATANGIALFTMENRLSHPGSKNH